MQMRKVKKEYKSVVASLHTYAMLLIVFIFCFTACTNENKQPATAKEETPAPPPIPIPDFNGDSAYAFVKAQVDFGPRVPGTDAHARCAEFLKNKLQHYGLETQIQTETVKTYDGKRFRLKNIIAEYKPELKKRILLLAHWDTRPWADQDSINKDKPFDGANDGASGVAVLLEIARHLSSSNLNIGIDILLSDLEDYGQEEDDKKFPQQENTWCLGTQYWAKNPHRPGYYAQFGILLDMVGGVNPVFPKEGTSMYYAPEIVNKVWATAQSLGYGQYFINATSGQTVDDHLYVNQLANIKCIDIVHYDINKRGYPPYHHTHGDNMTVIDKNTLAMTGRVVMNVIFKEN
jgi:hypothetical protein